MINTHNWVPDTHPTVSLEVSTNTDTPEADPVVLWAKIDGELVDNPQEVFDTIIAENRLKNRAEAFIISILPTDFFRQETDDDSDLVWLDSVGNKWSQFADDYMNESGILGSESNLDVASLTPSMVVKTKHTPKWEFGAVDKIVSFKVPGASTEVLYHLRQSMSDTFGDSVVVL